MNDPHVVALHYRAKSGPHGPEYDNPLPVVVTGHDFDIELQDGRLTVTMKVHCATAAEAKELVEPTLRAWEIESALQSAGWPQITFVFDRTDIIYRNPPAAGTHTMITDVGAFLIGGATLTTFGTVKRHSYPSPPTIQVSPDVERSGSATRSTSGRSSAARRPVAFHRTASVISAASMV